MRKILFLIFGLFCLSIMLVSNALYIEDLENGTVKEGELLNISWGEIWNKSHYETDISHFNSNDDLGDIAVKRMSRVILKFVDFIGYSCLEAGKFAMDIGYSDYVTFEDNQSLGSKLPTVVVIILLAVFLPQVLTLLVIISALLFIVGRWCYNKWKEKKSINVENV